MIDARTFAIQEQHDARTFAIQDDNGWLYLVTLTEGFVTCTCHTLACGHIAGVHTLIDSERREQRARDAAMSITVLPEVAGVTL